MNSYQDIHISAYDYPLPEARIAKFPLEERDESKLLLYPIGAEQEIGSKLFRDLPDVVSAGTLMVVNNTKVIHARLEFFKSTGGRIEVFLLEPLSPPQYEESFACRTTCMWHCLVGNAKKWKEGGLTSEVTMGAGLPPVTLTAEKVGEGSAEGQCIRFTWTGNYSFSELIEKMGELPIPPYLKRKTEESDLQDYQTVYARYEGSVAAPTAGLHFTDRVLDALEAKGVERANVTLHVGAGTFRPVKSDTMAGHTMHEETVLVPLHTLETIIAHLGKILSVGTTSTRTLESLYYMGVHLIEGAVNPFEVSQWEPYERSYDYSAREALIALVEHLKAHGLNVLRGATRIIIEPGFKVRIVDQLITNFHQPKSTLLLLISAFVGDEWHRIYDYALEHNYRFLSYGDSSLLSREPLQLQ